MSSHHIGTATTCILGLFILAATTGQDAVAKDAKCFETHIGHYPCDFRATGRDGSFEASSTEHGIRLLQIVEPGVGEMFIRDEETDRTFRAGIYYRSNDDRACWRNPEDETRFCAY